MVKVPLDTSRVGAISASLIFSWARGPVSIDVDVALAASPPAAISMPPSTARRTTIALDTAVPPPGDAHTGDDLLNGKIPLFGKALRCGSGVVTS
jgi:hypothetical protein